MAQGDSECVHNDTYTSHEVVMINKINDMDKRLTTDISSIKSDVGQMKYMLEEDLARNRAYYAKVDGIEHDMIKVKQWCLAIAAFAGGGASVLERFILG